MNDLIIQGFREALVSGEHHVLFSHRNPDGDAVGSIIGWADYLKTKGIKTTLVLPNRFPDFLKWIEGSEAIKFSDEMGAEAIDKLMRKADRFHCLDFNALSRFGLGNKVVETKKPIYLIDHHQDPESFPTVSFSDTSACSTCEMVVDLVKALDGEVHFSKAGATALFTGILTDSGSFKFPSTTAKTFEYASKLVELGADNAEINRRIYDTNSMDRLKLLGFVLHEGLQVFPEKEAALMALSMNNMEDFNYSPGDTEGFVNYPLSVESIKMSCLLKEDDGFVKVSLRSKGEVAVNELSGKYFNGGGHKNAAGGRFNGSLSQAIDQFKRMLNEME